MSKEGSRAGSTTGQTGFRASQLDEDENMSDEDSFRDAEEGVGLRPLAPPPSHSMTAAMGLNTHQIQVMKASFFGANERGRGGVAGGGNQWQPPRPEFKGRGGLLGKHTEMLSGMERRLGKIEFRDTPSPIPYFPPDTPSISAHLLQSQAPPTRATPIPTPSQSLLEFAGEDSAHYSISAHSFSHSARAGHSRPRPPAPPTSGLLQGQLVPRTDLNTLVPMSEGMVCGRTRLAADAGLFLGRSFRVGWGPNWTLSHSGSTIDSRSGTKHGNRTSSLQVVVEKVFPTPHMINAPPQKISVSFDRFLTLFDLFFLFLAIFRAVPGIPIGAHRCGV